MRLLSSFTLMFVVSRVFAQVEVNTLTENARAEFTIVSPGGDKGVLIPRMPSSSILAIASPVDGLLVYSSDNNTFYYYNGTAWQRIGDQCTIIQDNDGDTRMEVEMNADEDTLRYFVKGVEIVKQGAGGVTQEQGNLHVTTGTVKIGTAYSLPTTDGTSKYIMVTDGAGNISWQDPKTLPGLIAGLQTFPISMNKELYATGSDAYLTPFIPWSNITVTKISTYITLIVGSPLIELGIYDDSTLLQSGTVSPGTTGLVNVTFSSSVKLKAGKMYRLAILDRANTGTTIFDYPAGSLTWRTNALTALPATISSLSSTSFGKIFWFCLY